MAYAFKRDNVWVEITGGFFANDVNYSADWISFSTEEDRQAAGVVEIDDSITVPANETVIERRLVDNNGVPSYTYITAPIPSDVIVDREKRKIELRVQQAFNLGFAPNHPAFDGERLQCRDDTDRTNWLAAADRYSKRIAMGLGQTPEAGFRTQSNKTVVVVYDDAVAILDALSDWAFSITARGWALKDALVNGQPYDIEAGWPS